jgi:hypothetical protein
LEFVPFFGIASRYWIFYWLALEYVFLKFFRYEIGELSLPWFWFAAYEFLLLDWLLHLLKILLLMARLYSPQLEIDDSSIWLLNVELEALCFFWK